MQKKKTEIITARMTPADKKAIHQRSQGRWDDRHRLPHHHLRSGEGDRVDGLDNLLSELKAQGRNLNQLTTLSNMGRISLLRGDELLQEYTRLCDTLGALVREVR